MSQCCHLQSHARLASDRRYIPVLSRSLQRQRIIIRLYYRLQIRLATIAPYRNKTRPLVKFIIIVVVADGQRVGDHGQMRPLIAACALLYALSLWTLPPAAAQTVAVDLDSGEFLCSSNADCSEYYKGDQTQGEW